MMGFLSMKEQFFQLFNKQSDSIVVVNSEGNIAYLNSKAENMFKVETSNMVGQPINSLVVNYHLPNKDELQIGLKSGLHYFWLNIDQQTITFEKDSYTILLLKEVDENNQQLKLEYEGKNHLINKLGNLQNGIFSVKKDNQGNLRYTMAVGKLLDEIGANSSKLYNNTPFDVFPNDIASLKQEHYERAFEGYRSTYELELNGKLVYVDVSPIMIGGEITEVIGTVLDISELRTTQYELQANQRQLQSIFELSQEYIIIFDNNRNVINANPKTKELLELLNVSIYDLIPETYLSSIRRYFDNALQGKVQNFDLNFVNKEQDENVINVTLFPNIINNQIMGVYLVGKDLTEQRKIQETNAYLAHHDELTKLSNRRRMEQKISNALQQARENSSQLAILLIDLDRFKSVNDTLGHVVGDRLLEQIALRINNSINRQKHSAARMGGDEFMILCPEVESQEEVIEIAKNFLENLTTPIYIEDLELLITASIGISMYPEDGHDFVELMKKADIALYKSKELGRNMYQLFDQSMSKRNYQSFILERDLRKAIMNDEFVAYFQPRVNALTGKVTSAEALIRWNHPQVGLVSPGDFIPLAEESGLIIPMGKWMKRRVCEQLVAWREAGIPLVPISVNISSQRFLQKDFAKDIRALLEEYQLEGKYLEIEITENSIMKNEETVTKTLEELKELGVKIYIDDFGTGYSSFNYLKTFQLDGVKIDRAFIQNISSESENASITTAMIKMAHHLKLEVVAEGVETKQELDYLVEQNCLQIQGYYFGRPCPIEEFEEKYLLTV
ncbi:EAL domain-containing protein [Lysinibacillus antri]|uniref:EAL domain-containing protein n=2 Tax=Lysinibacillus antri TaxID=2498145 RepID=A0A3S0R486_9BACI|nr:EAL domain-containing protein [Lysinibacillus antri]